MTVGTKCVKDPCPLLLQQAGFLRGGTDGFPKGLSDCVYCVVTGVSVADQALQGSSCGTILASQVTFDNGVHCAVGKHPADSLTAMEVGREANSLRLGQCKPLSGVWRHGGIVVVTHRPVLGLTFELSGDRKRAKPACGCPLERGVSPQRAPDRGGVHGLPE